MPTSPEAGSPERWGALPLGELMADDPDRGRRWIKGDVTASEQIRLAMLRYVQRKARDAKNA